MASLMHDFEPPDERDTRLPPASHRAITAHTVYMQAKGRAYWLVDHRWPDTGDDATHATRALNDEWSARVDAICNEERDDHEEKLRKLMLLISRIKGATK
jgi:hypothetical protein